MEIPTGCTSNVNQLVIENEDPAIIFAGSEKYKKVNTYNKELKNVPVELTTTETNFNIDYSAGRSFRWLLRLNANNYLCRLMVFERSQVSVQSVRAFISL